MRRIRPLFRSNRGLGVMQCRRKPELETPYGLRAKPLWAGTLHRSFQEELTCPYLGELIAGNFLKPRDRP
jgi:hypothetical protein